MLASAFKKENKSVTHRKINLLKLELKNKPKNNFQSLCRWNYHELSIHLKKFII